MLVPRTDFNGKLQYKIDVSPKLKITSKDILDMEKRGYNKHFLVQNDQLLPVQHLAEDRCVMVGGIRYSYPKLYAALCAENGGMAFASKSDDPDRYNKLLIWTCDYDTTSSLAENEVRLNLNNEEGRKSIIIFGDEMVFQSGKGMKCCYDATVRDYCKLAKGSLQPSMQMMQEWLRFKLLRSACPKNLQLYRINGHHFCMANTSELFYLKEDNVLEQLLSISKMLGDRTTGYMLRPFEKTADNMREFVDKLISLFNMNDIDIFAGG